LLARTAQIGGADLVPNNDAVARIGSEGKWVIAVYLITVFIALPALVIVLIGVL
jgi:hypothetical protein